MHAAYVNKIVS